MTEEQFKRLKELRFKAELTEIESEELNKLSALEKEVLEKDPTRKLSNDSSEE